MQKVSSGVEPFKSGKKIEARALPRALHARRCAHLNFFTTFEMFYIRRYFLHLERSKYLKDSCLNLDLKIQHFSKIMKFANIFQNFEISDFLFFWKKQNFVMWRIHDMLSKFWYCNSDPYCKESNFFNDLIPQKFLWSTEISLVRVAHQKFLVILQKQRKTRFFLVL